MRAWLVMCVAVLLGASPSSIAQETQPQPVSPIEFLPALAGDYFAHDSQVVGRRFHIFVRLPEGYEQNPDQSYPVVYLLDGDSTFPMLAPQHLFLHYDEGLPEAIIVGIAYGGFDRATNMRHFDFRPVLEDGSTGGSAAFLQMMKSELMPEVETRFRAISSQRSLVGQSRGGSFVLYAAYHDPELFHGFIASNPGREWGDKTLYGMGKPMPPVRTNNHLIVASGSRDRDYLRRTAIEWSQTVPQRTDLPWTATFLNIEGGTHAASLPEIYRRAMLMVYGCGSAD